MSVVYFVKHKTMKPIKIGVTSNLTKRLQALRVSCPYGLDLIGRILSPEPKELESKLHKRLKSKRLNGEWFDISISEVKDIIDEYDEDYKSDLNKIHNLLAEKNLSIRETREIIEYHFERSKRETLKQSKDPYANLKIEVSNFLEQNHDDSDIDFGNLLDKQKVIEFIMEVRLVSKPTAFKYWKKIKSHFIVKQRGRKKYVGLLE